ncbi:MAG: amidohydrolase family protein [Acidimicrobiales bacterium]
MSTERAAWHAKVVEAAIDPDRPICDPHHHLWRHPTDPYLLENLRADTGAGHNVVRTVFLECMAEWRKDGPEHLRPVGETEFVAEIAEASADGKGAEIEGIMSYADLLLGDAVEEVLAAHEAAGRGRFRGIRYVTSWHDDPKLSMGHTNPPPGVMDDERYRAGVRKLGSLGYTYDVMVYHPQLSKLAEVARACPETTIVCNHLGAPLGVGPYRDRRAEALAEWRPGMSELAGCPNVVLKVGGIGMPMYGIRWDRQETPPTSEELAAPWRDEIRFAIDAFGPARCMFESNFPVDGRGAGYVVLWNAFKRIAEGYSEAEKTDLFHDCAARAYKLTTIGG